MQKIKELIPYIIIILVVLLIRTFIVSPVKVNGTSMVPILSGNEIMLLKKYDTDYERFDIVVVDKKVSGERIIKRIIGLPGEVIRYKNNKLYINDKIIDDVYAHGETENFTEIKLGKNEYFVMGDNREVSLDSRKLGAVNKKYLQGTVGIIIFPFTKIGNPE